MADVLRNALAPLGKRVPLAFVYGSMAASTERPGSDVDVMPIGSAGFADVALAMGSDMVDECAAQATRLRALLHKNLVRLHPDLLL